MTGLHLPCSRRAYTVLMQSNKTEPTPRWRCFYHLLLHLAEVLFNSKSPIYLRWSMWLLIRNKENSKREFYEIVLIKYFWRVKKWSYCFKMSFHDYYNAYVKRHVNKTKKCCQEEVTKLWNSAKQRFPKKENLVIHVQHEISQLLRDAEERKARNTLVFLNVKVGWAPYFSTKTLCSWKFI